MNNKTLESSNARFLLYVCVWMHVTVYVRVNAHLSFAQLHVFFSW